MFLHSADLVQGIQSARDFCRVAFAGGTLVFALGLTFGCGPKLHMPPTYPVRGKVVFRDGKPLQGGTILFQSQVRPEISASGVIGADGTFELASFVAGQREPGAAAGSHRVIVTPPFVGAAPTIPPIPPQTIVVSEQENNITVTIGP